MIPLAAIEGKYEILEKISEGGMGAVYKVRHRFLEELRVIKVMRPHLAADDKAKDRFVREAKLAAGLQHANIVQLYDFAIDEQDNAFLVLEHIEGVTLQELLKGSGPPSLGLTLEIARQSLAALAFLHHRGIIHRDISPDNIMVGIDRDGQLFAKLIDLGIAKLEGSDVGLTATGMFVGKVKYSSPEHFRAPEGVQVDARSDLYSLGVVLYELLTGQHPIPGTGVSNLIAGHLFHQPEPFARVDPECRVPPTLQSIVYRSLAKSPEDRYPGAEAMAAALAEVQQGYELTVHELQAFLVKRRAEKAASRKKDPGSTQRHLDLQFGKGPTPAPVQAPPTGQEEPPTEAFAMAGQGISPEMSQAATGIGPAGPGPAAISGSSATEVLPTSAPAPAAARRWSPVLLSLLAAAALVVAALLVTLWPTPAPPVTAPPGALIIDAVPWAEVSSVTEQSGTSVPLTGLQAFTPLRLAVPPGSYRIVVQREGQYQELTAEVGSNQMVKTTAVFQEVDVDELFRGLGL